MDLAALANDLKAANKVSEFLAILQEGAVPATAIQEGPFGDLWWRPMRFPEAGSRIIGHSHKFDHCTMFYGAKVLLRAFKPDKDGNPEGEVIERIYDASASFVRLDIKRDWWHEFMALGPGLSGFCIFPLRDFEGKLAKTWNGSLTPYV